MEPAEIDPVKYGVLWERVQNIDKKMDKMESQIEALLELANRGKGGLWFGMTVVSCLSGLAGFVIAYLKR